MKAVKTPACEAAEAQKKSKIIATKATASFNTRQAHVALIAKAATNSTLRADDQLSSHGVTSVTSNVPPEPPANKKPISTARKPNALLAYGVTKASKLASGDVSSSCTVHNVINAHDDCRVAGVAAASCPALSGRLFAVAALLVSCNKGVGGTAVLVGEASADAR